MAPDLSPGVFQMTDRRVLERFNRFYERNMLRKTRRDLNHKKRIENLERLDKLSPQKVSAKTSTRLKYGAVKIHFKWRGSAVCGKTGKSEVRFGLGGTGVTCKLCLRLKNSFRR
jgi:hypothetical protein